MFRSRSYTEINDSLKPALTRAFKRNGITDNDISGVGTPEFDECEHYMKKVARLRTKRSQFNLFDLFLSAMQKFRYSVDNFRCYLWSRHDKRCTQIVD